MAPMENFIDKQSDSGLNKRVVTLIRRYVEPRIMFQMILSSEWKYSPFLQREYAVRDRGMMALSFASAGRISEIVGGPIYTWNAKDKRGYRVMDEHGNPMFHDGILVENVEFNSKRILIHNMETVKRSQKVLEKYGKQAAIRSDYAIPLELDMYENPFWDQLVPFGWLIMEYLKNLDKDEGRLFPYRSVRAYQIIRHVTGNYPNWFRAQGENFYGNFLLTDSIKLSKFVNVQDPKHVKHYVRYSWEEQLKDKTVAMDFDWIEPTVESIKKRIS